MNKSTKFAQSTRKHRIGKERVRFVMRNTNPSVIGINHLGEKRIFWKGEDQRGLELEIIAVERKGYIFVTHVMPTEYRKGKKKRRRK